jgi:acyl-CoA thioesterase-2
MNPCLADLLQLLDLEALEVNLFRGQSRHLGGKSVYGGQIVSQALVAATRTVDGQLPHSLHAYFLRPGDMDAAVVYEVDRVRDGRSFTTRRVQAIQHGQPILTLMASFQRDEDGYQHQVEMPPVPTPEQLSGQDALRQQWLADELARNPALPERLRLMFTSEHAFEFA